MNSLGTYGDPEAGDPIQYDELRIKHDRGGIEIVVYNRAILLFMSDSEALKRIHEVYCRLDELATAAALIGSRRVDPGAWASPMAATYTYSEGRRCRRQRRRPPHPYRCNHQSRT